MIRELYREEMIETALHVTQGQIDAIRRKNIVKSGCRVYEHGYIGIAGTLGEATDETWKQAEENLSRGVPYPYAPSQDLRRHEDRRESCLDTATFTHRSEELLQRLRDTFPHLIFSNMIFMNETVTTLRNDAGLDYEQQDLYYLVVLLAKDESSAAVFETVAQYEGRSFDVDTVFQAMEAVMTAHGTPVVLPQVTHLPLILDQMLSEPLLQSLNGQLFHRNASLFSGKTGQHLFNDKFSFYVDRSKEDTGAPFFDAEGSVLPDDRCALIENGVLLRPYADKKTAAEFDADNTASAGGSYDDLPQLAAPATAIGISSHTLQELLQGRDAALVMVANGGDCTPDGMFATPVQTAYLYRNGKLLGRLPEFSARGSLFDLFGDGYIGRSADKPFGGVRWLAVEAEITP